MKKSMKMTLITVATVVFISQPLVGHTVVTVDPGAKVSAGKTIVGSSQKIWVRIWLWELPGSV